MTEPYNPQPPPYLLTADDVEVIRRARDLLMEAKGELGHIRDWWLELNASDHALTHLLAKLEHRA